MKQIYFISIFLLIVSCQQNPKPTAEEKENLFNPMIRDEITYISKNIEGLENDKGKEWYKGDSIYFLYWKKGASEELAGNLNKAADFYIKALKTKRYELSSYEVKLSLGRVYLQMNDKAKAKQMLTEFKKEAQKELSGNEVEWGLTEEAKEALANDVEDCDYLLGMVDAQ